MKIELIPADAGSRPTRKSPAQRIKEQLEPGYLTIKDVAKRYNMHEETIRRITRKKNDDGTPLVKAPSLKVQQGGLVVYVFTPEDIEEMDAYFAARGRTFNNDK